MQCRSADAKAKWCCAHLPGAILSKLGTPRSVNPCPPADGSCQMPCIRALLCKVQCGCSYPEETLCGGDNGLAGATNLFLVLPLSFVSPSVTHRTAPRWPSHNYLADSFRTVGCMRLHKIFKCRLILCQFEKSSIGLSLPKHAIRATTAIFFSPSFLNLEAPRQGSAH
jgi:hypothetical protein